MRAGPADRTSSHEGNPYRGLASASLFAGLLLGIGAFLVAAFFMGIDYFAVRNVPSERAVVVSVTPSGTKEICGPRALAPDTPGERTTYRSTSPRVGLPVEFAINHCPDWDDQLGDVVTVRRTGLRQDDIYVEPIETAGQWMGMAGSVGVAATAIATVVIAAKEGWGIHRAQRRIRRRSAQGPE